MLADDLKKLIQGDVMSDEDTLSIYSTDYSIFKVKPKVVVFPKNKEDVEKLVAYATEKKKNGEEISLTGRSAGTDMSGGPLNDSVIVEFTKYFNHIREIKEPSFDTAHGNDGYAVVEPGVYFRDFEKELDKKGLLYPSYPASKDLCAMGGMVNNNSGGEKTLEYGKTEKYVEEITIVLADGKEHVLRSLPEGELREKLKEESFEGDIYRNLFKLIEDNYDAIQAARPNVSKNSAGYFLWNIWDKKTFDITKLIVGSQGTLGLLTSAKVKLLKKKKYSGLLAVFSKTLEPVPGLVEDILRFNPEGIESYDDRTMKLAVRFLPSLLKLMKGSVIKLFFQFLPEFWMMIRKGAPRIVLLVSFASDSETELRNNMDNALEEMRKHPVVVRVMRREEEAEKYWAIRRQSFNLLHRHVKGMYAAPFIDDVVVDPKYMPEFLQEVNAILDQHKDKLVYTIAGHPGNGNFHIIPLVRLDDEETRRLIPEVTKKVYELVFKYGGSMTAEHNDGLIRTPYLEKMYGAKIVSLFEEVKRIFDPVGIFNPRKKVGGTIEYAKEHMRRE